MKTMSAQQARATFSDVLVSINATNEPVVVQEDGKPVAVIISPEAFERQQEGFNQRFWETVDRIRERNAEKNPDEELTFITEVVEEVRQERHDEAQRKTKDRR